MIKNINRLIEKYKDTYKIIYKNNKTILYLFFPFVNSTYR